MKTPRVSIVMGSDSDLPVMQAALDMLEELGVPFEVDHRRVVLERFLYTPSGSVRPR